jgi:hypothetical protein
MANIQPGYDIDDLKRNLSVIPHLSTYINEAPPGTHIRNNERTPSILGIAEDEYSISTLDVFNKHPNYFVGGNHGYTTTNLNMQVRNFIENS